MLRRSMTRILKGLGWLSVVLSYDDNRNSHCKIATGIRMYIVRREED